MSNTKKLNRDFKGIWIPKELWLNNDLTITERCVLAEIDSLDDGNGCWASNGHFAKIFQSTTSSMSNVISGLRSRCYIINRKFNGRQRWISVNWKLLSPTSEPCIHSNREGSIHPQVNKDISKKKEKKGNSVFPLKSQVSEENTPPTPPQSEKPQIAPQGDKPPAQAKARKETWLTAYNDLHIKYMGGSIKNMGAAAKAFKSVETSIGREKAVPAWEEHCKKEGKFASPVYFASKPLMWVVKDKTSKQRNSVVTEGMQFE